MNNQVIKVVIADDFDLIRQGLNRILSFEEDIKLLAEASDGQEAINYVKIHNPDVLVVDMNMPQKDGLEVLKFAKEFNSEIKVIILTVENDRSIIKEAISIGADGYILKESVAKEIVSAINLVCKGEKYIDRSLVSMLFTGFNDNKTSVFDDLSFRELQILQYISKGYSNKEIAEEIFISEKTVKNYITKLFRKIDVNDRVKATILAIENDIEEYIKNKN